LYIHEAVKIALREPSTLTRQCFQNRVFLLVTPNRRECIYVGTDSMAAPAYGWEPSAEDLAADDWIVTRAEGIRWPESTPAADQRLWKRLWEKLTGNKISL